MRETVREEETERVRKRKGKNIGSEMRRQLKRNNRGRATNCTEKKNYSILLKVIKLKIFIRNCEINN